MTAARILLLALLAAGSLGASALFATKLPHTLALPKSTPAPTATPC